MKRFIVVLFISIAASAVVAETLLRDTVVARSFRPESIAQGVIRPLDVDAYRVAHTGRVDSDGNPVNELPLGFLGPFPVVEVGPKLNADQVERFCAVVGDSNTYDIVGERECLCCYAQPEYGFAFAGQADSTIVFFGPSCEQLFVCREGRIATARTRGNIDEIDRLLGELFPD